MAGLFEALLQSVCCRYLDLLRQLQRTYWLEPAGYVRVSLLWRFTGLRRRSKGAWGLDDYQFLGFLWGAAQLSSTRPFPCPVGLSVHHVGGQTELSPRAVLNQDTVKKHADNYMYFGMIQFVTEVRMRVCLGSFFPQPLGLAPDEVWSVPRALERAVDHQRPADVEQGQHGTAENVRRRGAQQVPHRAARPVWRHLPLCARARQCRSGCWWCCCVWRCCCGRLCGGCVCKREWQRHNGRSDDSCARRVPWSRWRGRYSHGRCDCAARSGLHPNQPDVPAAAQAPTASRSRAAACHSGPHYRQAWLGHAWSWIWTGVCIRCRCYWGESGPCTNFSSPC